MTKFGLIATSLFLTTSLWAAGTVYDFTMNRIDGNPESLAAYKGKVLLIVNVASRCGFTPQYTGLQSLYTKYKDQGFVILGFPANNFGGQEPGTDGEIKTFCSSKYSVTFPMFSKTSVKGSDTNQLYRYLTSKQSDPAFSGDIKWNFTKFLIGRDGRILARFEPDVTPESPEVVNAVSSALR